MRSTHASHASLITQTENFMFACSANHMVPTLPNAETRHPVVFGHHDLELLSGDPEALAAKQSLDLRLKHLLTVSSERNINLSNAKTLTMAIALFPGQKPITIVTNWPICN